MLSKPSTLFTCALILAALPAYGEEQPTTWKTDFPDTNPPKGITLYQSNDTVSWKLSKGNLQLSNSPASMVEGKIRRPGGFALAPGKWKDVTLTVEARSLSPKQTINRDICLIFGYVDDTHFYYAHLSQNSDGKYHTVIMRVNGNTRETIHKPVPLGTDKGPLNSSQEDQRWQTLRVTHKTEGSISVFIDDMDTPFITANDTTYPVGRVGCGTFDDPALFRSITVSGRQAPEN